MTKMENPIAFSRRSVMKGGGALVVSLGMPMGMNTLLAINSALAQDARPPLKPDQLVDLYRRECRRQRHRLLRQDGHGPGPRHRGLADDRRRARCPGESVKLVMGDTAQTINQGGASSSNGVQNGGKQLAAAAAEARRVLIEMAAQKLGMPADKLTVDRRRDHRRRCQQERHLCRVDRRALLQCRARLEQADRQRALCARQGQAEEAERIQDRRHFGQAHRRGAESLCRRRASSPTSSATACCMRA